MTLTSKARKGPSCPFCKIPADLVVAEDDVCRAVRDRYPVSPGHTLIIPRRHVASFRDMTSDEWNSVHRLAADLAGKMQVEDSSVQGFNLGINDGRAAGQTVMHAHIHLIPRRLGDVQRPEGGVRGVIPGKARYGELRTANIERPTPK
jgi:ATP adenylyltransferase